MVPQASISPSATPGKTNLQQSPNARLDQALATRELTTWWTVKQEPQGSLKITLYDTEYGTPFHRAVLLRPSHFPGLLSQAAREIAEGYLMLFAHLGREFPSEVAEYLEPMLAGIEPGDTRTIPVPVLHAIDKRIRTQHAATRKRRAAKRSPK